MPQHVKMKQAKCVTAHRSLLYSTIYLFLILFTNECRSLKLLELRVPAHVPLGTPAQLSCRWVLAPTDVLYSVKWYKDGKEFFRHVPGDRETLRKYPLPGVDVEESDLYGNSLKLSPVSLETSGRYRCEVSGEKPLFPTVSEHADLEVIVLPEHGPIITGFLSQYNVRDRILANCTSGRSKPATKLTWYINGEPAPTNNVHSHNHFKYEDGLETTSLVLDVAVGEKDFRRNKLKVKCLATLSPFYWKSNEDSASRRSDEVSNDIRLKILKAQRAHASSNYKHNNISAMNRVSTVILMFILFF